MNRIRPINGAFRRFKSEMATNPLRQFNILQTPAGLAVSQTNSTGFTVGQINYKGPILVFDKKTLAWDVPQYGVGGPNDDVDPIAHGAHDDPASPFYGWVPQLFSKLAESESKPDILIVGCGAVSAILPDQICKHLMNMGIQVDVSATV